MDRLVSYLRRSSVDDVSYSTIRHGRVSSFRGVSIEGDELAIGHPPIGTPETVSRHGYVARTPLDGVPTDQLQSLVGRMLWHGGAISYAEMVALEHGQLHERVRLLLEE